MDISNNKDQSTEIEIEKSRDVETDIDGVRVVMTCILLAEIFSRLESGVCTRRVHAMDQKIRGYRMSIILCFPVLCIYMHLWHLRLEEGRNGFVPRADWQCTL